MGNFKTNLLEYYKYILVRVSFSKRLFWKEYRKSIKNLPEPETHSLKRWMVKKFSFRGRVAAKLSLVDGIATSAKTKLKDEG